jgi:hypothetical protein
MTAATSTASKPLMGMVVPAALDTIRSNTGRTPTARARKIPPTKVRR